MLGHTLPMAASYKSVMIAIIGGLLWYVVAIYDPARLETRKAP